MILAPPRQPELHPRRLFLFLFVLLVPGLADAQGYASALAATVFVQLAGYGGDGGQGGFSPANPGQNGLTGVTHTLWLATP